MEWRIQIADEGSRLTVTAWGAAEVGGFLAYLQEAVKQPGWYPEIPALMDFRQLDVSCLSPADIVQLAELHLPYADTLARSRIAVLVSRPVDYGVVRMWEALVHQMNLAHAVFYSLAEAEAWLQTP